MNSPDKQLIQRIHRDLRDSCDEEYDLELEDRDDDPFAVTARDGLGNEDKEDRKTYFRELFRLQAELVKLQEWVVNTRAKVVILFEGRDAAGKGV